VPAVTYDEQAIHRALAIIETVAGSGSGFIVQMGGRKYVLTNQHVLLGGASPKCRTLGGVDIAVTNIEFTVEQDLARFPAPAEAEALTVAADMPLVGDWVSVYGNSQGRGVATKLEGKVLGVGPDELEVSTEFVGGNSGSPIITRSGQVLGVASYATCLSDPEDWLARGTRFTEPRRFGVRLLPGQGWVSLTAAQYTTFLNLVHDLDLFVADTWLLFYATPEAMNLDWISLYTVNKELKTFKATYATAGPLRYADHSELGRGLVKALELAGKAAIWSMNPQEAQRLAEASSRCMRDTCLKATQLVDDSSRWSVWSTSQLQSYRAVMSAFQAVYTGTGNGGLEIVRAVYYSPRNKAKLDATAFIRNRVVNGKLTLKSVNMAGLGDRDIDYGIRKVLMIKYRHNGQLKTFEASDGDPVNVP
jgi:hypothetical protein